MEDEKKMPSTEEAENDIEVTNELEEVNQVSLESLLMDLEDEDDGEEIEEAQVSLDALLLDSDDVDDSGEDDNTDFEAFMAEYRSLISKTLSDAADAREAKEQEAEKQDEKAAYEQEYLYTPIKKKAKTSPYPIQSGEIKTKGEWNEDITLEPEEYEDLVSPDEEITVKEEEFVPDFDLGEIKEGHSDGFQMSISFEGGEKQSMLPDEDAVEPKYDPEKPRAIDWVFDIAEMFVFVLAIVILLTSFVFKHSVVEGESMNNTLEDGDHLIISDLFYTPERGDIIVFEDYSTMLRKAVVKRVIGLPGETVEVKLDENRNVTVYINGVLLEEDYAYNAKDVEIYANHAPITLGEDEIFVMGDNRYHSTDSRHSGVGPIKIDSILGKVLFRFFPFDGFGAVD